MSNAPNQYKASNDGEGEVYVPLTKNLKNMDLYDDEEQKPVGNFLTNVLSFNKPQTKETTQDSPLVDGKKQKKAVKSAKLGTVLGVFLPCVQNIFGVILFIRASWIVGTGGIIEAFVIVGLCCGATMLTSISTSAIATNGIVPAGGPYFMISRSLGPECGGAVGILFYLGNVVAAAMYVVGAVEIFLKYIFPDATLIGDIEVPSDAFHNFRIYGSVLLVIIGCIVCIGIKFVSKIAPVSLIAVLVSVICIYVGIIKSAFAPPDLEICVFNGNRLIRYDSYVVNGVKYCTNNRICEDNIRNVSFDCPLWEAYCGPIHSKSNQSLSLSSNEKLLEKTSTYDAWIRLSEIELKQMGAEEFEKKQKFISLCSEFEKEDSVELRKGIPGMSSKLPITKNWKSNYLDEDEYMTGEKGVKSVEVLGKEYTSFLILLGIYFPSVTGIMAGANRSGDLKDPSKSIPRGTITAVAVTSFIYLSNVIFFGSCIDGLLLRDKFGDSINKQLVVSILAWPSKWIIVIGAFLSTFGAGLQTLTSAPRLLQAISKDEVIPFLKPLAVSDSRGEPLKALLVTLVLVECGILLGNVDYLTPLIAMFFLMCYGLVNFACALQTLLKAPSWRPRYKYYHWSLSLLGVILCLAIMFIIKWYYAIVAIFLGIVVYKYVEYKGAEKEWGDGLRGLSMSAARYALLNLQQAPPHVKNWRPQILLLLKCKEGEQGNQLDELRRQVSDVEGQYDAAGENENDEEFNINVQHPKAFGLVHQLKAGKGLVVCSSVIPGDFVRNKKLAKASKNALEKTMAQFKAKGFCDALVSQNIEEGISSLIQNAGLGGLRHNTVVVNWPDKLNKSYFDKKLTESFDEDEESKMNLNTFVQTLRLAKTNESAIIITKGIDTWPINSKVDTQTETIDLWWIIHDGGLLLLIVFLLKKNKIWQNCKVRLFTVARADENSIKIKNDLAQFLYFLRIEADVDVLEMTDSEISAFAYEKTLKLHEREKLIRDLKIKERKVENEPQVVIERIRRNSIIKNQGANLINSINNLSPDLNNNTSSKDEEERNKIANQYTFSPSHPERRPSVIQSETVRKMHSAVELNKRILEKSKNASLVLMNIPQPPKFQGAGDYNYMAYIHAATEGLNRVLLIRGSEREVVTIFS